MDKTSWHNLGIYITVSPKRVHTRPNFAIDVLTAGARLIATPAFAPWVLSYLAVLGVGGFLGRFCLVVTMHGVLRLVQYLFVSCCLASFSLAWHHLSFLFSQQ